MDTSIIDDAITAAVTAATASPAAADPLSVPGWTSPLGSSAFIQTDLYETASGIGFTVTGTIVFPNGFFVCRSVDVGPNASSNTIPWPASIEAALEQWSEEWAERGFAFVNQFYSPQKIQALQAKWGDVVAGGAQSSHPLLAATKAWIDGVIAATLIGGVFPPCPGTPFMTLMAEGV